VGGQAGAAPAAPDPAREQRLAWFRDAKYGLFIHWGLYAIPAGEWKGRRSPGLGEWIMNRSQIPVSEYEQLAARFNPVRFNADEWVRMAEDAGMKYIVITSKHHDGFAMFGSTASKCSIVDATPFKRDAQGWPTPARSGRCASTSLLAGWDWREPGGAGNTWDFGPDQAADGRAEETDDYLRGRRSRRCASCSRYGPVALIWFDAADDDAGAQALHRHRPDIPSRSSTGGSAPTTLPVTGDNVIPAETSAGAWETPATISDTWGFRTDDTNWKSPGRSPSSWWTSSARGNYLLNVGPTARGVIPQASRDNLRTVGRWLKVNGDAVYGAGPSPFGDEFGEYSPRGAKDVRGNKLFLPQTEWRVTAKPGKLYVTFFSEPRVPFELPVLTNTITRAYRLADKAPVDVKTENGRTFLDLERPIFDPMRGGGRRRRKPRRADSFALVRLRSRSRDGPPPGAIRSGVAPGCRPARQCGAQSAGSLSGGRSRSHRARAAPSAHHVSWRPPAAAPPSTASGFPSATRGSDATWAAKHCR
jgi:alpha-L-fucosidase